MNRHSPERCKVCGAPAAVRMQGVSLCGRCGLERSNGGTNRIKRRTALLGIISSGFLAKMLLGAVAVAAVGGVAVTLPHDAAEAPIGPASTQTLLHTDAPLIEADLVEPPPLENTLVKRVQKYVEELQQWGDCVSAAASEHSGGPFDPKAECDEMPAAAAHGLATRPLPGNSADAPGQQEDPPGNSADAPGQQEDPPGNSADAPGQQEDPPGNSADAPGKSNE